MIDKKQEGNSPKLISNSNKSGNILNNNATGGSPPSPTSGDVKSTTLFKKVCMSLLLFIHIPGEDVIITIETS